MHRDMHVIRNVVMVVNVRCMELAVHDPITVQRAFVRVRNRVPGLFAICILVSETLNNVIAKLTIVVSFQLKPLQLLDPFFRFTVARQRKWGSTLSNRLPQQVPAFTGPACKHPTSFMLALAACSVVAPDQLRNPPRIQRFMSGRRELVAGSLRKAADLTRPSAGRVVALESCRGPSISLLCAASRAKPGLQ
jgi:hypothetical protein